MRSVGQFRVYDWNERVADIDGSKSLLIGNGFSIALLQNVFSYSGLATNIDPIRFRCNNSITNLLKSNRNNFEELMRLLEQSREIIDTYNGIGKNAEIDARTLRKELVRCITSLHPSHPFDNQVSISNYATCGSFLKSFSELYSTNYDLLLYWAILKGRIKSFFDDGFRSDVDSGELVWQKRGSQNVFYLHGALHIFSRSMSWDSEVGERRKFSSALKNSIVKIEMTQQMNLIPQITKKIENGSFPLTVTDGLFEQKVQKIINNPYLKNCFERFSQQRSNNLISIGWSGSGSQDQHIFDSLVDSYIQTWWFGVFRPSPSDLNKINRLLGQVNGERTSLGKQPIKLEFFFSDTAPIW